MSERPEWVKALEAQPCQCVRCDFCKGRGTVYFDMRGRYVGSRRDDLDEPELCEFCSGGVTEDCDRCVQLKEYNDVA